VRVTGTVTLFNGRPQIVVKELKQVRIVEKGEKRREAPHP
jgi:hypothetical protein